MYKTKDIVQLSTRIHTQYIEHYLDVLYNKGLIKWHHTRDPHKDNKVFTEEEDVILLSSLIHSSLY